MTLRPELVRAPLCGVCRVPGDKSLAHRAALFAALAEGESQIADYPDSGVTRAMRGALASLGVVSELREGVLRLRGNGLRPFPRTGVVAYCGHSATTIRLLAGALAATGTAATLDGSEGLRRRPMSRIAEPLRRLGAEVTTVDGHAPLTVRPAPLQGAAIDVPVASAQVLSCLQIAALGAASSSRFTVSGPVRDHTVRMLRAMGATIADDGRVSEVTPCRRLEPLHATLPGDPSSAAFLFAAAAIVPGSRVTVTDMDVNPGRTGFLDVLAAMGASVTYANRREEMGEPVADVTVAAAPLHGVSVAGDLVVRTIDEFPALAAVAAFAEGETTVREAEELRYKETDRIAAIVMQFRALGADVEEFPDGFVLRGGTLSGGTAQAGGDHRLAMALALAGLRVPVAVEGAEILAESFPDFISVLDRLRT